MVPIDLIDLNDIVGTIDLIGPNYLVGPSDLIGPNDLVGPMGRPDSLSWKICLSNSMFRLFARILNSDWVLLVQATRWSYCFARRSCVQTVCCAYNASDNTKCVLFCNDLAF